MCSRILVVGSSVCGACVHTQLYTLICTLHTYTKFFFLYIKFKFWLKKGCVVCISVAKVVLTRNSTFAYIHNWLFFRACYVILWEREMIWMVCAGRWRLTDEMKTICFIFAFLCVRGEECDEEVKEKKYDTSKKHPLHICFKTFAFKNLHNIFVRSHNVHSTKSYLVYVYSICDRVVKDKKKYLF